MNYADALHQLETWDGKLFASVKLKPWQTALWLFLGLVAFYFVAAGILHTPLLDGLYRDAFPFWWEFDTILILCVLSSFIYASEIYLQRGIVEDINKLTTLVPTDTHGNDITDLRRRLSRRSQIAVAVGAMVGIVYVFVFTGSGAVFLTEQKLEVFFVFAVFVFPMLFARNGRAVALGNPALTMFRQQYGDFLQVDVFDREAYRPFVRIGMRSALHWLFLFAILTILLLDEGNNRTIFGRLPMVFLLVGLAALVATYEFVQPLLAARNYIMREKARETTWVVSAIKDMRTVLKASDGDQTVRTSRLSDLLAYKGELDRMSDWPVDSPDIGRFIVYLLIPVMSWFGGAGAQIMVEGLIQ